MADEEASADEGADGAEGEEGGAKKRMAGKKIVLFAGLPALVLILGGAAAFLLLGGGDKAAAEDEHAEVHGEAGGDGHGEDGHGTDDYAEDGHGDAHGEGGDHAAAHEVVFYELPELLVNIQSEGGRSTYLKLKLMLELDSAEVVAEIEPAMPRVMDRFQGFLRELRVEDLSGSAGSYRLRLELLRRVNLAAAPAQARAVLIQEMIIQ